MAAMKSYPKLAADPGRIAPNPDNALGELELALFRLPPEFSNGTTLALAASSSGPGWKRQYVEIHHAGRSQAVLTPRRKSVLGRATRPLGMEADATTEVVLHDPDQWLVACTDEDLELGENLAAIGKEIIQFGRATSLDEGHFRLTRLLRGRQGARAVAHDEQEQFLLIDRSALQLIALPASVPGSRVRAVAQNGTECSLMLDP